MFRIINFAVSQIKSLLETDFSSDSFTLDALLKYRDSTALRACSIFVFACQTIT